MYKRKRSITGLLLGDLVVGPGCCILVHPPNDDKRFSIFLPDNDATGDPEDKLTFIIARNDSMQVCSYSKTPEGVKSDEMREFTDEELFRLINVLGISKSIFEAVIKSAHLAGALQKHLNDQKTNPSCPKCGRVTDSIGKTTIKESGSVADKFRCTNPDCYCSEGHSHLTEFVVLEGKKVEVHPSDIP